MVRGLRKQASPSSRRGTPTGNEATPGAPLQIRSTKNTDRQRVQPFATSKSGKSKASSRAIEVDVSAASKRPSVFSRTGP